MKKTSVYIISITAALALLLCACGARTGNMADDVKDDVEDAGKQVVDGAGDITDEVADGVKDMTGSDGIVRDDDGIIDDDDTGRVNQNGASTVDGVGDGMPDDVPGMTDTGESINAGSNSLDADTDDSIGANTTDEAPTAR